jgi:L-lysine 6-transaminase
MGAIDLPDTAMRDAVADKAYEFGAIILPCGPRSLRFRPPLDTTREEVDEGLDVIARAIERAATAAA